MSAITPVIMAGGTGTRLWPLSRRATPKQYRPLVTDRTMFEETVERDGHTLPRFEFVESMELPALGNQPYL